MPILQNDCPLMCLDDPLGLPIKQQHYITILAYQILSPHVPQNISKNKIYLYISIYIYIHLISYTVSVLVYNNMKGFPISRTETPCLLNLDTACAEADGSDAKSEDAKVPGISCRVKGDRPNEMFIDMMEQHWKN